MGTRAIIHVCEDGISPLVSIYRQYDGYPSGLGMDIKHVLNDGDVSIVDGYSSGMAEPAFFNGMGCLAAWLIKKLKNGIGGVYIYHPGSRPLLCAYQYVLYPQDLKRECKHGRKILDLAIETHSLGVFSPTSEYFSRNQHLGTSLLKDYNPDDFKEEGE